MDPIAQRFALALIMHDEAEVRRMLGFWISELPYALAIGPDYALIGLVWDDAPMHVKPQIVVPVSQAYLDERAAIVKRFTTFSEAAE